jgi:RNase P/RNase MRP subunit p30
MEAKPVRLTMWRQRPGASARDRTYFRLPLDVAAALLARVLWAESPRAVAMVTEATARALRDRVPINATWHVEGAEWHVTAAVVEEAN